MTTAAIGENVVATPAEPSSRFWADIAFHLSGLVAAMPDHDRGGFAGLRRMDPDEPDTAAFWRLMAGEDLLGIPQVERKWGLILHGMALMTRTSGNEVSDRYAHNGSIPVGRALYLGGEPQRTAAFYSETRFNRLLTARDDMLRVLLTRTFRMLGTAQATFDWREMAAFILNDGYDEERAEIGRRRIAREYYRAERRGSQ